MGIEKDIHQTHFTGESQKGLINIIYTYHWLTDQIRKFLAEEDITLQQFNILRILRGSDPQPLSTLTIRDRMLDKMSDTSRIVDRLVLKGLTEKRISAIDKRLVDVNITKEGKKLLQRLDTRDAEMTSIMSNLNNEELKKLSNLLDKLRGSKE
jgi:MarR family 2-MHQ and catechol resistance regulon transcriptional repressor